MRETQGKSHNTDKKQVVEKLRSDQEQRPAPTRLQLKSAIERLRTHEQQLEAANELLRSHEQQLETANEKLQTHEHQLEATNEKLKSREQQLDAANQQLQAHEQQLRAANQQLDAANQQLKAHQQQQVAINQQLNAANQQLSAEIAERKRTHERLLETHSIYQKTIENAKGVPYQMRVSNFKYTFIGSDIEGIVGIAANELDGATFDSLIKETIVIEPKPSESRMAELLTAYHKARSEGDEKADKYIDDYYAEIEINPPTTFRTELQIRTPQGKIKWLSDCSLYIKDEDTGKISYQIGIVHDITERKLAEQELLVREQQLQAVNQQLRAANQQLNATNQQLQANEQQLNAINQQLGAANQQLHAEIIERKRTQEELVKTHTIYRRAIENASGVPYQVNMSKDKYSYVGTGIKKLLGVDYQQLLSTNNSFWELAKEVVIIQHKPSKNLVKWADAFNRGDSKRALKKLEDYNKEVADGKVTTFAVEYLIETAGGEPKWISNRALYIRDEKTDELEAIGVLQDISESKLAQLKLERSEAIYRETIEITNGVPYKLDLSSRKYTFMGSNIEELTGIKVEDITDTSFDGLIDQVYVIDPDPSQNFVDYCEAFNQKNWELANAKLSEYHDEITEGKVKSFQVDVHINTLNVQ